MTMNERADALIARLTRRNARVSPMNKAVIDDDTMRVIVESIRALAHVLTVPDELIPSMLDLASDNVLRSGLPSNDQLLYAHMLNIFSLYFISDDTFDDLMTHFADDEGIHKPRR